MKQLFGFLDFTAVDLRYIEHMCRRLSFVFLRR